MDHEQFDDLTRSAASRIGTRRQALRALGGALLSGTLAGVATRLGLTEITEATKARRKQRASSKSHDELKSEGTGKKKHHKKHDKKRDKRRHKKPQDADIPLCPLTCEESGKKCCDDGSCVVIELCCPGQRMCADGSCQPQTQCCDDEWKCPDGTCGRMDECCPGIKRCGPSTCVQEDQCCPDAPIPDCSECQEAVCANGEYVCRPKANCVYCNPESAVHCGTGCCLKDNYYLDPESGHHWCYCGF